MARYKTLNGVPLIEANRFSVFIAKDDIKGYADLVRWEQWFTRSDIPCVIALMPDGYALYRLGLDDA